VVRIDFTLADWSAGVPPSAPESWSTPHSYASHTISTIDSFVI
jgi:hypothetical protein